LAFWTLLLIFVSWNTDSNTQYYPSGQQGHSAAVLATAFAFHHAPLVHIDRHHRQHHHRHGFPTTVLSLSSSSSDDDNNKSRLKKDDGAPLISEPQGRKQENTSTSRLKDEADRLLAQARALRQEIASATESDPQAKTSASATTQKPATSPWSIVVTNDNGHDIDDENAPSFADYRLYVDIGREPGTWMEPRWGASGKRIEFTLDVRFCCCDDATTSSSSDTSSSILANKTIQELMVQDNLVAGQSSPVYKLHSAPFARLRNGFDRMSCTDGGYRIDTARNKSGPQHQQQQTIRFFIQTRGIGGSSGDGNDAYGDINVPAGCLYFSLPMFMNSLTQLSKKEGVVSVRQGGWNTGWYRQESRIVGVFRAVPIQDAKRRDGF
jgi:hypothetical protein